MRIGELAQVTGTPVETVRYYEKEGLLPQPGRSDANYRVYASEHVDQLQLALLQIVGGDKLIIPFC